MQPGPRGRPAAAVFELSVDGLLGPVFRSALRRRVAVDCRQSTLLRFDCNQGRLVELIEALTATGMVIESIRTSAPPHEAAGSAGAGRNGASLC